MSNISDSDLRPDLCFQFLFSEPVCKAKKIMLSGPLAQVLGLLSLFIDKPFDFLDFDLDYLLHESCKVILPQVVDIVVPIANTALSLPWS